MIMDSLITFLFYKLASVLLILKVKKGTLMLHEIKSRNSYDFAVFSLCMKFYAGFKLFSCKVKSKD